MKYIMIRIKSDADLEHDLPIIFPECMVHSLVFEAIRGMKVTLGNRTFRPYADAKAVSAGSITLTVEVGGRSETLNLEHRECDDKIIMMHDYFSGLVVE